MTTGRRHHSWPLGATITTVFSVALVLLLAGIIAATSFVATSVARQVQESASVSLSIANSVMPDQLDSLDRDIAARPFVARTQIVTRAQALQQWKDETGEDLVELLGENPLNATIEVYVKVPWASADSLASVRQQLETLPGVVDVWTSAHDVDNIVSNTQRLLVIIGGIMLVMLVIAVALIMSLVRLLTYSQRFHIHTMTLVGARTWFIVKPYMWRGALMGLVAAVLATAVLLTGRWMMGQSDDALYQAVAQCLDKGKMAAVVALMTAMGTIVGAVAAALAARKYTRATHDELYA